MRLPHPDMAVRRLSLVLFMLLSLDFGNPFVGGAFTFEGSEEGIHRRQESAAPDCLPGDVLGRPAIESRHLVSRALEAEQRPRRQPLRWAFALPRSNAESDASPAPSDDH